MQISRETNLDLPKECDYIVSKALAGENMVVIMGCLIFLANESGDAFALDMDDKYACPLCVNGEKQRYPLFDSGIKWGFNWPWRYSLARGRIYFESIEGEAPGGLPWMKAAAIEREVARYNRRAGTNSPPVTSSGAVHKTHPAKQLITYLSPWSDWVCFGRSQIHG